MIRATLSHDELTRWVCNRHDHLGHDKDAVGAGEAHQRRQRAEACTFTSDQNICLKHNQRNDAPAKRAVTQPLISFTGALMNGG